MILTFNGFSKLYHPQIEANLRKNLPDGDFLLYRAMRYSLFPGGKRIRPLILLASYSCCGGRNPKSILDLASAVEILHTYSLIHDDLPSMDDDDYRRGRLSCHKKFSEAAAVLAGDALLTLGMKLLSRDAKAAEILGEALGADGMIRGQALDIENNPSKTKKSRAARIILDIHLNKTAKFIGACAETGAYLAGQNPGRMRALREYGLAVGMAFQIRDDLLDLKEPGWNYPKIFGVRKAEEKVKAYTETALNKISFIGERGRMLEEIALKMSRRIS